MLALLLALFLDDATSLENTTIELDKQGIVLSLRNYHENEALKQTIQLAPLSDLTITVTDIPTDIWFIVLQIHTFQYNATLAYDKAQLDKVSNGSLFGSNIGLYLKTHNVLNPIQVFLKHDNVHHLDALLVIVTYGRHAPIPGGCNMEFDIEVAPYQKLNIGNGIIIVDTQPSSAPATNNSPYLCEKSLVQHKMYRLYLPRQDFTPETYFDAIASMLLARDIVQNADEVPSMSPMRHIYSAYPGTGSVYAAVATYGNYSSAYVPSFTYACSPELYPESCQMLNDSFAKVICAVVFIVGCLSVLRGHKYSYIDRSLSNGTIGGIIGYSLAVGIGNLSTEINIAIGLMSAFLAAAISGMLYACIKLHNHIPLGILCACITYLYAPVSMFYVLESDWMFWPMFIIFVLTIAVFLNIMSHVAEIFTRAVFGSFFVIVAIDYYTGSSLKYIIITLIRRCTIPEFYLAYVYPPHQGAEKALISIWFVLMMIRIYILMRGCGNGSVDTERETLLPNVMTPNGSRIRTIRLSRQRHRYYLIM